MRSFLHAVDGAASRRLVNCVVRPVLHPNGQPVFGDSFTRVGVAGRLIHQPSLQNARQAIEIIRADQLARGRGQRRRFWPSGHSGFFRPRCGCRAARLSPDVSPQRCRQTAD